MSKKDSAYQEFSDDDGNLGRPVPSGQIRVPEEVGLEGDFIRWRMGRAPQHKPVSRDLLDQFIRLADAQSVLRFAKRWGVLAVSGDEVVLPSREEMIPEGREPIAAWLAYSRRARAVLNVAAALKDNKLGDVSDWGEFTESLKYPGPKSPLMQGVEDYLNQDRFGLGVRYVLTFSTHEERVKNARRMLEIEIRAWLDCWKRGKTNDISDLALHWLDDHKRWELQLDYHGLLFPAIALQLALVIAEADSLYSCSGCGFPYIRPRARKRPKSGWANYCFQCTNDGVAQRRAAENYREKKSTAMRLGLGGMSVKNIAEQLRTPVARVSTWLKKESSDAKAQTRK